MHGEHPHLVAPLLHITLDFGRPGFDPVQKRLKRARLGPLVPERKRQKFFNRVGRFLAKPRKQLLPSAQPAQNIGKELIDRHKVGTGQQLAEERPGFIEDG